jgi:hypothetical protein
LNRCSSVIAIGSKFQARQLVGAIRFLAPSQPQVEPVVDVFGARDSLEVPDERFLEDEGADEQVSVRVEPLEMRRPPPELLVLPGVAGIVLDETHESSLRILHLDSRHHQAHGLADVDALKDQELEDLFRKRRQELLGELLAGDRNDLEGGILGGAGTQIEMEEIEARRLLHLSRSADRRRPIERRGDARGRGEVDVLAVADAGDVDEQQALVQAPCDLVVRQHLASQHRRPDAAAGGEGEEPCREDELGRDARMCRSSQISAVHHPGGFLGSTGRGINASVVEDLVDP